MCGIIGILGRTDITAALMEGLSRLEYRGYDSAGIALVVDGTFERQRAKGKLANLASRIEAERITPPTLPQPGVGIGHTRWATHGIANEQNAHPHATSKVALVHNGIIENFHALKEEVEHAGHVVTSQTDSEIIVHLIHLNLERGLSPLDATRETLDRLEGAFALAIIFADHPHLMIAARHGSPLAIGHGKASDSAEMYLGSDALAMAHLTDTLQYLEDGDVAVLEAGNAHIYDRTGASVPRPLVQSCLSAHSISKGGHDHFMLKEIHEQPFIIGDTLHSWINPVTRAVTLPLPTLKQDWNAITCITLIGCGSAFYAGLTARYWLARYAGLRADVDMASEFRYGDVPLLPNGLAVFISQSGETMDTLACLRYAKKHAQHIGAIVNAPESTIARAADTLWPIHAGPEISVASTKAFTSQLCVLAGLAIALGKARATLSAQEEALLVDALISIPTAMSEVLAQDATIEAVAKQLTDAKDILYMGRDTAYPIALEGALKLKEISYIHAEGYAAGEMKHGPIALIDESVPIVLLAPSTCTLFDKTLSNMQEIIARGGTIIFISDKDGIARARNAQTAPLHTITMPHVHAFVAPMIYSVAIQLLAYHVARLKGTDVDQPRNLAKSVTVE